MALFRSLLNVATALAILQALTKVAEFCLDGRQQQAFQEAVDRFTLRLIDLNPIQHYSRLSDRRVQMAWFGFTVLMVWAVSILSVGWHPILRHGWLTAYFVGLPLVMFLPFRATVTWLARSVSAGRMLLKAVIVLAIGVTAQALVWIELYEDSAPPLYFFLFFGMLLGVFFYAGLIVIVLYAAQAAVWLFMQIFWRIATYAKGAWSAVIFVVAGLLAVVRAVLPKS